MKGELDNLARRILNAEGAFVAYAMKTAGLDECQAHGALAYYKRHKLVKIDAAGGQFTFTHGAYAEAGPLLVASQIAGGKP